MEENNTTVQTEQNQTTQTETPQSTEKKEVELTADEQLQQMRVELAKLKKATDKATSEAANYKKQLREKQSADEIAAQEKAEKEVERQEQFEKLLKENTVTKFEKNYLSLGYPEELATKAATAQYESDTDALFKIQSDFQATYAKKLEAEWLKNRPEPQIGTGEDNDKTDPFLKGFGL